MNVKVVSDASRAISEHFARYPDVPLVLNENAANIPDDALIFDGETPLDPGQLVGDHLVIVDESLSLSGLEHAQAAVADAARDPLTDGLADQIPIVSFLSAAVRSGYKEGRLLVGGKTDLERALKNVLVDTAVKGGGATAGGIAGAKAGLLVDAALGGTSLGLGGLVGGLIGAVGGALAGGQVASHIKLAPLREAQSDLMEVLGDFEAAVAQQKEQADADVRTAATRAAEDFQRRATTCHTAYETLLEELAIRHRDAVALTGPRVQGLAAAAERSVDEAVADYVFRMSDVHSREDADLGLVRAARRAADQWRDRMRTVLLAKDDRGPWMSTFFDVLMATPAGQELAVRYLKTCADQSRLLRTTALEGNRQMTRRIRAA
ncbi:hypothetical protein [Geodermatophilus saharensis]|uniref:hypothetical protein n=1 Tax=Geodermatophilus saharensis TaxID=1137994 RepID=UPI000B79490C|nr:hypothetical protein [Geodermatophilus saharensis]